MLKKLCMNNLAFLKSTSTLYPRPYFSPSPSSHHYLPDEPPIPVRSSPSTPSPTITHVQYNHPRPHSLLLQFTLFSPSSPPLLIPISSPCFHPLHLLLALSYSPPPSPFIPLNARPVSFKVHHKWSLGLWVADWLKSGGIFIVQQALIARKCCLHFKL